MNIEIIELKVPNIKLIKPKTEVFSVHLVFGINNNTAISKSATAIIWIILFFDIILLDFYGFGLCATLAANGQL